MRVRFPLPAFKKTINGMKRTPDSSDHYRDELSKLPPDEIQRQFDKKVDRLVESDAFKEAASGQPQYLETDKDRMLELMGYRRADMTNEGGTLSKDEVAQARRSFYDIKEQFVELFGSEALPEEYRS